MNLLPLGGVENVNVMTDWEFYYVDHEDDPAYSTGLFQLTRADISEENPVEETVSFGAINIDFKEGEIVGIEIYENAEQVIGPAYRNGSVNKPVELSLNPEKKTGTESLIDRLDDLLH